MLKIWDASNFRRTLGGLCLILAPLTFAVVDIGTPGPNGDPVSQLATMASHHAESLAYIYLHLAYAILFIPAYFALLQVVRTRGVVLGHIAGVLALMGTGLGLALGGLQLILWAMASPGVDRQAMVTFLNSQSQSPVGVPIFLGHYLMAIGILLFGIAVWRSGFGYRWAGPLVALAPALDVVTGAVGLQQGATASLIVGIVSDALLVTGFAAIGFRVLTMSDAAWESGGQEPDLPRATATVAVGA